MSTVLAFFDMDYTILRESSGRLCLSYLRNRGKIRSGALLRTYWSALLYKLGRVSFPTLAATLTTAMAERNHAATRQLCQQWFDEVGIDYVASLALQRVLEHRERGHCVTIISASTTYVVGPVAAHCGVKDYLCTQLEVVDGSLTGEIIEPACYGLGKVHWAQEFAARHGASLAEAYFYSDGYSDRPLLEEVGHPVAVNPEQWLRTLALERGWPIESFY